MKKSSSPEPLSHNFNHIWHKASLSEGDSSLFKSRALPFMKGRYLRNILKTLTKLKKIFSRITGSFSTKLGTMHLWVKGIQVCSNEGLRLFGWEDNYEIAKIS